MEVVRPKKVPTGLIQLQLIGELVMPKLPEPALAGVFRRYQALFEGFANMDRDERILNYKMVNALILTSHAKKAPTVELKKNLFELKNKIFIDLANNRETRRKMAFKYLTSKNFRVLEFCKSCVNRNQGQKLPPHSWKFCGKCTIDRSFYNVLSMHHRFKNGFTTLFLSNDQLHQVKEIQLKNRGNLSEHSEESRIDRFQYNVRNLDSISLKSALTMFRKLMPDVKTDFSIE